MSALKLSKIFIVIFLLLYFYSCNNKNDVVYDVEGNSYKTITIGSQTWMAENLRATKYQNGDDIGWEAEDDSGKYVVPLIYDNEFWKSVELGLWCDYNNDSINGKKYGHIYNWYAITDERNIAPIGWHVATDDDWKILSKYIDETENVISYKAAKSLASKSGWDKSNELIAIGSDTGKNNSTGFNGLPGGYRKSNDYGGFGHLGYYAVWWSASEYDNNSAYIRKLGDEGGDILHWGGFSSKHDGYYVRCVKNQE